MAGRKPKKELGVTRFGPSAMLREPETAAHLGAISNAWAMIEARAADFMAYMVSEPNFTDDQRRMDPLGTDLFSALLTWKQRWAIMRTILKTRLTDKEWKSFSKRFETLSAALAKAAKLRNTLVHSIWGQSDAHKGCLIRATPYLIVEEILRDEAQVVDQATLMEHVTQLQDALHLLESFYDDVRRRG